MIKAVDGLKNYLPSISLPSGSMVKKVALVFSLVFGVYLVSASIRAYICRKQLGSHPSETKDISKEAITQVSEEKPLNLDLNSLLDQETLNALDTAEPFKWGKGPLYQPVDTRIAKLTTIYVEKWDDWKGILDQRKSNPLDDFESIEQATDKLMKMSYVIGILTLQDLQPFTKKLAVVGQNRTFAETLATQDSYLCSTFYYCTMDYHDIRGGLQTKVQILEDSTKVIPDEWADLFYKEGTLQYEWRKLYNDYCVTIRTYVTEEQLSAGPHGDSWTKQDIGKKSFATIPATLPN